MNERIQELAREAGFYANPDVDKFEKFAELIIQECLGIVNRYEYSYHDADPLWETAQLIKQHFGISNIDTQLRNRSTYFGNNP